MTWKNWGDHPVVVSIGIIGILSGLGYTIYDHHLKPEDTTKGGAFPTQPKNPSLSSDSGISKTGVAIVFDPPSNVRKSPNAEEILCSVREKKTISIYNSTGSWYWTDVCGTMGVIDSSQVTFQPK